MEPAIDVIGIGADEAGGLNARLAERIQSADFVAGGERHLSYFPAVRGERFVIRDNLDRLVEELRSRTPRQRCVVLASGDPLFYGIGKFLVERLEGLQFYPTVSSMQLAFARAQVPWQDAALASIHGRNLRTTLVPLLGRPLIGLFAHDGGSPAAVARFFLNFFHREDSDPPLPQIGGREPGGAYSAFVGENLGSPEERCRWFAGLRDLLEERFSSLNYMILRRDLTLGACAEAECFRALVPGIPDQAFWRPEDEAEVMTRQEVRCVLLGKLLGPTDAGDTVWDIGAGLGTVAVEVAVLRPHVEVVAVEQEVTRAAIVPDVRAADIDQAKSRAGSSLPRVEYLRRNRLRFDALNIRVVPGMAPQALAGETEHPRLVFIGGSGGRLPAILDFVQERLRAGGRLVASFVTLENLTCMLERVRAWRWPFEVTEVHVARSDNLASLTGLKPQRGVFLVRTDKPEATP